MKTPGGINRMKGRTKIDKARFGGIEKGTCPTVRTAPTRRAHVKDGAAVFSAKPDYDIVCHTTFGHPCADLTGADCLCDIACVCGIFRIQPPLRHVRYMRSRPDTETGIYRGVINNP